MFHAKDLQSVLGSLTPKPVELMSYALELSLVPQLLATIRSSLLSEIVIASLGIGHDGQGALSSQTLNDANQCDGSRLAKNIPVHRFHLLDTSD